MPASVCTQEACSCTSSAAKALSVLEAIHRAIWSMASPERKRLDELCTEQSQSQVPLAEIDDLMKELEDLRKDRQVLTAHGKNVYQECKGICAELQGAARSLHDNAIKAQKKKDAASKGRFF